MPLGLLIALVVGGIAGIAVLTWALGLAAQRRFPDQTAARAAFAREYPETRVQEVILCQSASAALVSTDEGLAVVWPMGADSTARLLDGACATAKDGRLNIKLPDFTAPRIQLSLAPAEADTWANKIEDRS